MRDNIVENLLDTASKAMENTEAINKRLINLILVQTIVFCLVLTIIIGLYLYKAYDYTQTTQEVKQEVVKDKGITQEARQQFK